LLGDLGVGEPLLEVLEHLLLAGREDRLLLDGRELDDLGVVVALHQRDAVLAPRLDRPEPHLVAVLERRGAEHLLAVDPRPTRGLQVLDEDRAAGLADDGVGAAHVRVVEDEIRRRAPPEDLLVGIDDQDAPLQRSLAGDDEHRQRREPLGWSYHVVDSSVSVFAAAWPCGRGAAASPILTDSDAEGTSAPPTFARRWVAGG